MQEVMKITGVRYKVQVADLDKDGVIGEIETLHQKTYDKDQDEIKESTELGDVMNKAFEDKVDPSTRTSTVDMIGNVEVIEEKTMLVLASLVSVRYLPSAVMMILRLLLRYSISRNARGRDDIRDISVGKKEQDIKAGLGNKISNLAGFNG